MKNCSNGLQGHINIPGKIQFENGQFHDFDAEYRVTQKSDLAQILAQHTSNGHSPKYQVSSELDTNVDLPVYMHT